MKKIDVFLVLDDGDMKPEFVGKIPFRQVSYDHFSQNVQYAIRHEGHKYAKYTDSKGRYNRIFPYSNAFGRFCAVNGVEGQNIALLMSAIEGKYGIDPSEVAQIALCWEVNDDPKKYGVSKKATRVDLGYQGRGRPARKALTGPAPSEPASVSSIEYDLLTTQQRMTITDSGFNLELMTKDPKVNMTYRFLSLEWLNEFSQNVLQFRDGDTIVIPDHPENFRFVEEAVSWQNPPVDVTIRAYDPELDDEGALEKGGKNNDDYSMFDEE